MKENWELINFIIKRMVENSEEIKKARTIGMAEESEHICFREGCYDAYYSILLKMGFDGGEIEIMEKREQKKR